jgi:FkbM family methyltransferase
MMRGQMWQYSRKNAPIYCPTPADIAPCFRLPATTSNDVVLVPAMLQLIKNSILRVSRFFGYEIVPLREMKARDFALHLRAVLAHQNIDCILDVGANVGQYHDFLRDKVLYGGPIVSFEPVGRNIDRLRERAQFDSAWHIEGYALGAAEGTLPLNVMVSDQFSSFLEPDNSRAPDIGKLNVPSHVESVAVRTLDFVLPALRERLGFERPYLKLDTQGFDMEVMRGGSDSLSTVLALQTEASVIGIYQGMPTYIETIRYLGERGFELSGLYPVARDSSLRLFEFDCVMIRADARRARVGNGQGP